MRKANATIWILGWGLALLLTWAPMAGADTYTYTYNAADQLASVQGPNGAASYTYDGDGQRTTRSTAAGQTIYVRDPQGEVIAEYSGTTGALVAEYVYVDGQRLCKITHDAQGVERRVYYHQDVVGTPVAETNESGQVLVRANYTPFGEEVIPGAATDPHKFTGKELDDESGLTYFGARYYDAHLGRFVTVDPLAGIAKEPESWNRYAYARNNPLKFVDPDGRQGFPIYCNPRQFGETMVAAAPTVVPQLLKQEALTSLKGVSGAAGKAQWVGIGIAVAGFPEGTPTGLALSFGSSVAKGGADLGATAIQPSKENIGALTGVMPRPGLCRARRFGKREVLRGGGFVAGSRAA